MKNIHVLPTDKEPVKGDLEKEMFELEQELDIPSNLRWHNSKPKQETLEEAAERLTYHDTLSWENTLAMESFKLGAKWQQERMYSEEEVKKLIELHSDFIDSKIDYEGINNATTAISNPEWNDDEWFEKFKKK